MTTQAPIILAIDTPDLDIAKSWIEVSHGYVSGYKLGLEFFTKFGKEGVRTLQDATDAELFLDLKFHDIPNTVASATKQIVDLNPRFLTIHASGGRAMIAAAVAAAPNIEITAVTILTSLGSEDLKEIGFKEDPVVSAVRLAKLAKEAGATAIVCSPQEISAIRAAIGPHMTIITPGVRLATETRDDQQRTMDPKSAIVAGASYLVIGRPITQYWSQGFQAMRERTAALANELSEFIRTR
ncbi:MAG TPA: orotidine-5'-phosphate decarboxylase [Candidatus Paceibacterota bacterium]|nr:orotidine-5'-phosphate decarboxylase [Candidatus Paceibacterota bacterium]